MRHHNNVRKFGRKSNVRRALIRGLANNLIIHEQIKTTEAKAKELAPWIEKLVTHAKNKDVASIRLVIARLGNRAPEAKKLVDTIAPRYMDRNGGYTRVIKLPQRLSDGAAMAIISFV
jgi:large subunit ribosomal protein L17